MFYSVPLQYEKASSESHLADSLFGAGLGNNSGSMNGDWHVACRNGCDFCIVDSLTVPISINHWDTESVK